jgi:hypothetical protein
MLWRYLVLVFRVCDVAGSFNVVRKGKDSDSLPLFVPDSLAVLRAH